jgi:hypothetical protein
MKIVIDTTEFSHWAMKKYGLSNSDWHKIIWRPFMCDYFMDGNGSVGFSHMDEPTNIFEEHMNEFIKENSQLGTTIWIEFTN